MLKRYTFWLWGAAGLQLLTAAIHTVGLFVSPSPENDTERQLYQLINTYQKDLGAGFRPTFSDLFTALSSCFAFVCVLGGLVNVYLLKKRADAGLVRGITGINILVFGAIFVVMARFTFLPPIICSAFIVIFLATAFVTNRGEAHK